MTLLYKNIALGLFFWGVLCVMPCLLCKNKKKDAQSILPREMSSVQSIARTITVTSQVTEKQLEVHYWGTHLPDTFSLLIQEDTDHKKEIFSYDRKEKRLSHGAESMQTFIQCNNTITLDYSYSFAKGLYKATKRVHFKLPENIQAIEVSFSFDHEQRVLIPQAQFLAPIESVS